MIWGLTIIVSDGHRNKNGKYMSGCVKCFLEE